MTIEELKRYAEALDEAQQVELEIQELRRAHWLATTREALMEFDKYFEESGFEIEAAGELHVAKYRSVFFTFQPRPVEETPEAFAYIVDVGCPLFSEKLMLVRLDSFPTGSLTGSFRVDKAGYVQAETAKRKALGEAMKKGSSGTSLRLVRDLKKVMDGHHYKTIESVFPSVIQYADEPQR